jgi:hypothetical protein
VENIFGPVRFRLIQVSLYILVFHRGYHCYNGSIAVYVCGAHSILLLFYIYIIMLKLEIKLKLRLILIARY